MRANTYTSSFVRGKLEELSERYLAVLVDRQQMIATLTDVVDERFRPGGVSAAAVVRY